MNEPKKSGEIFVIIVFLIGLPILAIVLRLMNLDEKLVLLSNKTGISTGYLFTIIIILYLFCYFLFAFVLIFVLNIIFNNEEIIVNIVKIYAGIGFVTTMAGGLSASHAVIDRESAEKEIAARNHIIAESTIESNTNLVKH